MSSCTRCSKFHAELLVRHFAASKPQRHLHLVAVVDKLVHVAHLHVIIVIVDIRTHLDFLDVLSLLRLARGIGLFLGLVFELAHIQEFGDREAWRWERPRPDQGQRPWLAQSLRWCSAHPDFRLYHRSREPDRKLSYRCNADHLWWVAWDGVVVQLCYLLLNHCISGSIAAKNRRRKR